MKPAIDTLRTCESPGFSTPSVIGNIRMNFDLVIANARMAGHKTAVDIGVRDGLIAAIDRDLPDAAERYDAGGSFAFGGFVETHIHLDKAMILGRCPICEGTLKEAVRLTAAAKSQFSAEDVSARASQVVDMAVARGTMVMRSFVEVDPRAGMRSFEALRTVQDSYRWAIDIELCAFAQEGTTNEPQTLQMLDEALRNGASSVGGCPYTDPDPAQHISTLFDLAERHDVPVDFHADFDLDPKGSALPWIVTETRNRGYGGRVSVGHATKLSAMAIDDAARMADDLADTGVAVTILPATDLFLAARNQAGQSPRGLAPGQLLVERGVTVSLATNNVMNPFTPYGDASLLRMANLYANTAQIARDADIGAVFSMVSDSAAQQLGVKTGLAVGQPADIVLLDAPDEISAVRSIAQTLRGWKGGRASFTHDKPKLLRPSAGQ